MALAHMALAAIGLVTVGVVALRVLALLYKTLLRGGKNLRKEYGAWAVVTGATDGIGKAMAFELARKGMNVLLVGRSASKLADVKSELSGKCPTVEVATETIDFATFSSKDKERVADVLAKYEVGLLVNNVGISYPFPQWLHELTDAETQDLMTININSVVWMTRAVLPQMLDRKRGAIVNLSSASAKPPAPLLTVYAATKGFVENFTRGCAFEYAGKGIHFQCQSPLWVATAITFPGSKVPVEKRASMGTPSAPAYARCAVARIGYDTMVSPYWLHELVMYAQSFIPDGLVGGGVLKMHAGIRYHKKNIQKMEEKALAGKKSS